MTYAATLIDFPFEAMLHVNYGETVLHIHGLPKQLDFPQARGGPGTALPESPLEARRRDGATAPVATANSSSRATAVLS